MRNSRSGLTPFTRTREKTRLIFEQFERRDLLSADGCIAAPVDDITTLNAVTSDSLSTDEFAFAEGTVDGAVPEDSVVSVLNSDAGSTLATAHDLGSLTQPDQSDPIVQTLPGSLSYFDRLDIFRFELSSTTDLDVALSGLRRNADLILADANGRSIANSRNSGSAEESLSLELSPGTFYIGVASRNFWGTQYQLGISATNLELPEPPSGGSETPETPAAEMPASETPTSDARVPETDGSTKPFADVAYFGSRTDWNVNAVNAPESWAQGYTGEGITVAVVDTGVDLDHPDLATNIFVNPGEIPGNGIDDDQNGYIDDVSGYDFVNNDSNPDDGNGHGTHVAGTIASLNNGSGSTGVAPNATILPVKVLSDAGSGSNFSVAAGIRYAADLGAEIINLSLGGGYSRAIQSAVSYANSLGSIVIAAAGNENAGVPSFPAQLGSSLTNVLSVGAHNSSNQIARFSNDVGGSGAVQIDAPGVGIYSTYSNGRYGSLSGTSMASPHIAGVAALALSANPDLSPEALRGLLIDGTTTTAVGSDAVGIVNAATTVAYAAAGITSAPSSQPNAANFNGNSRFSRTISFESQAVPLDTLDVSRTKLGSAEASQVGLETLIETSKGDALNLESAHASVFGSADFLADDVLAFESDADSIAELLEMQSGEMADSPQVKV
ncbi:MAG: S8 family serine peptidase [Pirellulaceae bacterium]